MKLTTYFNAYEDINYLLDAYYDDSMFMDMPRERLVKLKRQHGAIYSGLIKRLEKVDTERIELWDDNERLRIALADAYHIIGQHGTPVMRAHATRIERIRLELGE